jgi:hypothetical protein
MGEPQLWNIWDNEFYVIFGIWIFHIFKMLLLVLLWSWVDMGMMVYNILSLQNIFLSTYLSRSILKRLLIMKFHVLLFKVLIFSDHFICGYRWALPYSGSLRERLLEGVLDCQEQRTSASVTTKHRIWRRYELLQDTHSKEPQALLV